MADGFEIQVDTKKLEEVIQGLSGGIDDLLAAAATEIVGDIVMGMQQSPASGRTYKKGSRVHVASAPGDAPRPDTGELMGSITHAKTGEHEETVHDQTEYGQYLEFGTEDIAARPFMKPVFEAWGRSRFAELVNRIDLVK